MNPALAVLAIVVGLASTVIGAWTAAQGRRPGFLGFRVINPGTARRWGAGTALAGLGLVILGANGLGPQNRQISLAAVILILVGAGVVTAGNLGARRSR